MISPKLLLTIVTGGVALGALMGQMANPQMKFADGSGPGNHRESEFSSTPMQSVETGPEDLSPSGWFGPAYAQPATFAPQDTHIPEYAPPTGSDGYSSNDKAEPYIAPEVDQASLDSADAAAALTEAPPASTPRSEPPQSQARSDTAPSDLAPADKTS